MSYKLEIRKTNPAFNFGPWYDHYIRPFGKCHVDFDTHVIGDDPRGVKVCTRRDYGSMYVPRSEVRGQGSNVPVGPPMELYVTLGKGPGNYVNSSNMYNYSPSNPSTVPNDKFSIEHQYKKVGIPYDGVGIGVYDRYGIRK